MTKVAPLDVVFRVFPEGDVIALFPSERDRNMIMSYQHLVQHSLASPELVRELRPATPAERANLLAELKRIGYHLRLEKEREDRASSGRRAGPSRSKRLHHSTKKNSERTLFAVEIDPLEFSSRDELPEAARWHDDFASLAEKELGRGRSYRRPLNARYSVIEWTGYRGALGRLLDWLERTGGITRYAEIFE